MASVVADRNQINMMAGSQEHFLASDDRVEIRSRPENPLIIHPEQKAANEYFGILRARLLKARNGSSFRSFLITSPQRQDGKSYTSVNLAISLAQLKEYRVLLIDGDLRLRGLSAMLELEKRSGLADFLQEKASFEECVKATTLPQLFVVPAGAVPEDSLPGILQGPRWPDFLEEAKRQFDLIVVDSVPVTAPIADLEILLSACDTALMVVNMRRTTREAIDFSAQRVQQKLLGVVVNRVELRTQDEYSHYGSKRSHS